MSDDEQIVHCQVQADREREAATATNLPMVRDRHLAAAIQWERMVERAKLVAANRGARERNRIAAAGE